MVGSSHVQDELTRLGEVLVERFVQQRQAVEEALAGGDVRAGDWLAALAAERICVRALGGGAGVMAEAYLSLRDGRLRLDRDPDALVQLAVEIPGPLLGPLRQGLDGLAIGWRPPRIGADVAEKARQAILAAPISCDLKIIELPPRLVADANSATDVLVLRWAMQARELPVTSTFSATISWDDLLRLIAGEANIRALFSAGRVKLGGDYGRALMLIMQLPDPRSG